MEYTWNICVSGIHCEQRAEYMLNASRNAYTPTIFSRFLGNLTF